MAPNRVTGVWAPISEDSGLTPKKRYELATMVGDDALTELIEGRKEKSVALEETLDSGEKLHIAGNPVAVDLGFAFRQRGKEDYWWFEIEIKKMRFCSYDHYSSKEGVENGFMAWLESMGMDRMEEKIS